MPLEFRAPILALARSGILSWTVVCCLSAPALAASEVKPASEPVYGAYLAGIVAGAFGDSASASARLLDVLHADPTAADVREKAFLFSALAGSDAAATLAPMANGNPLAALVLGNEAARRGDWAAAQSAFAGSPSLPLNNLMRPLLVAWSQQGAGRTDLALATLTPLVQDGPLAGIYALHAAMIADLAGRTTQAGRLYQQAMARYPGSDLVFVQSYASFLYREGRSDDAKALVHALAAGLPLLEIAEPGLDAALPSTPVKTAVNGLARAYLTMAWLLQQQKNRNGSETEMFMLRFALDLQPDLASALLLLSDLQTAAQQPSAALSSLRRVAAGDPLAPVAALRIGLMETAAGEAKAGRQVLEGLVARFPGRPEPLQELADVLQEQHRYAAAIDAYGRAIRLMSPLKEDDWPILFSRATAYDRNRQWIQAQADLEQALRLAPNQPFLLNYLGYSWVERRQDLQDARMMIERALDAKPEDGSIRDSLGWALFRQNDVPGAVRTLERAAEQMPEDPTVNYHLGAAYWAAGRRIEARDQWRWALILHPGRQDEARIRTALRSSMRPGADPVQAADALPLARP